VRLGVERESARATEMAGVLKHALQVLTFVFRDPGICEAASIRMRAEQPVEQRCTAPMDAAEEEEALAGEVRHRRERHAPLAPAVGPGPEYVKKRPPSRHLRHPSSRPERHGR
jgi:hypothetical protein